MEHGDVLTLGKHRLLCGDAFNAEHVDALMQCEKPVMLYCDPPYGAGINFTRSPRSNHKIKNLRSSRGGTFPASKSYPALIGDDRPFNPTPILRAFDDCQEHFWWGADYYRQRLPDAGSWIVWDKRVLAHRDVLPGSCFELCWSRRVHRREIVRIQWAGIAGIKCDPGQRRYHPTQKPVALAEWFISRYSKEGDIILDLFGGSGSTLLACERLNRRALIAEISPDYCQVIIERYERLTQQPSLLDAV